MQYIEFNRINSIRISIKMSFLPTLQNLVLTKIYRNRLVK